MGTKVPPIRPRFGSDSPKNGGLKPDRKAKARPQVWLQIYHVFASNLSRPDHKSGRSSALPASLQALSGPLPGPLPGLSRPSLHLLASSSPGENWDQMSPATPSKSPRLTARFQHSDDRRRPKAGPIPCEIGRASNRNPRQNSPHTSGFGSKNEAESLPIPAPLVPDPE